MEMKSVLNCLDGRSYDLVVGAVAHRDYRELPDARIESLVAPRGTLADLKGMWRDRRLNSKRAPRRNRATQHARQRQSQHRKRKRDRVPG